MSFKDRVALLNEPSSYLNQQFSLEAVIGVTLNNIMQKGRFCCLVCNNLINANINTLSTKRNAHLGLIAYICLHI